MTEPTLFSRVWDAILMSAFGSDELQSYSAEYTWYSNQMAHAMMGFCLATFWFWLWRNRGTPLRLLIPYTLPFAKVAVDAYVVDSLTRSFAINWWEFVKDKATDLSFWWLGMFLAQGLAELIAYFRSPAPADQPAPPAGQPAQPKLPLWRFILRALAFFGVLTLWVWGGLAVGRIWVEQKKTFDRSNLPPGWIRLCQVDIDLLFPTEGVKPEYASEVEQTRADMAKATADYMKFVTGEKPPPVVHCVIRGGWPVNRSELAVALGTEFAARRQSVYYHTASKLLENPEELDRWKTLAKRAGAADPGLDHPLFPRCVVVDDLAGSFPRPPLLVNRTPKDPNKPYDTTARMQDIFNALHDVREHTSTVWVVTCNEPDALLWLTIIREYMGDDRVIDINLGDPHRWGNPHQHRAAFKRP